MTEETKTEGTAKVKKEKKLSKSIEGFVITLKVGDEVLVYDGSTLSPQIKDHLIMHGLSQKLGDSAAGKEGKEAVASIKIVWEGLSKGDWSTRAPAGEKISKSKLSENVSTLAPKEQEMAKKLLEKLGIKL